MNEYEEGSRHVLKNAHTGETKEFDWIGGAWSTPGTGWATKPAAMSVLGWKYHKPVKSPLQIETLRKP